jgi:hypothetical protein
MHDLSFNTCVKTLSGITISRQGLLQLELAVGLAVFLDFGVADRAAKTMLQEVYSKAGYDCADSAAPHYKTVNRRIQASAALFGKISLEVLNHWVDGKKEGKLLQAIAQEIVEFGFKSMDDVLDHVGRASNRGPAVEGQEVGVAEAGSGTRGRKANTAFDIQVGDDVVVHLPRKLTEANLVELATKIMALAQVIHDQEAAAKAQEAADAAAGLIAPLEAQDGAQAVLGGPEGEAPPAGAGVGPQDVAGDVVVVGGRKRH